MAAGGDKSCVFAVPVFPVEGQFLTWLGLGVHPAVGSNTSSLGSKMLLQCATMGQGRKVTKPVVVCEEQCANTGYIPVRLYEVT